MRLLVTGGAGFIGSNFVDYCMRRDSAERVVVLDALTYAGSRSSLPQEGAHSALRFVQGDILDQQRIEALLHEECIDTIVHFAAESHVDRSIDGPEPFVETNVLGTFRLLEAARRVWLSGSGLPHRFHQISTDEVYGSLSMEAASFTEQSGFEPNSPYSASKAAADHFVRAYHRTYGLQVSVSACSNNYGPRQFPEKLLPLFIINALHGRPLPVYGNGGNVRDWLYVEDHCRLLWRVLEKGRIGARYNISGACEVTNLDIVTRLCRILDEEFEKRPRLRERYPQAAALDGKTERLIRFVEDRPGHDLRYSLDDGESARELGFDQRLSLDEGLRRTVRWYLDRPDWWQPLMQRS